MKHKLLKDGDQKTYAIIMDMGDEVMENLKTFANNEKLSASHFNAIGAFSTVTVGYFEMDKKDYKKIEINEQVEVLNLAGDITLHGDDIKIHAHVVVGKKDGTAHGGHLMEATARPTLEIILSETPAYLKRSYNEEAGTALIEI